jgi:hypothetical protein
VAETKAVPVRLTEDEREALKFLAAARGSSVHALLVSVVRQAIDAGPMLLKDDLAELQRAHAEAYAIGRNLNQLVRAVHTGKAKDLRVENGFLETVARRVEAMQKAIRELAERQHARWVPKLGGDA